MFLAKALGQELFFLHHFARIGGTRTLPEERFFALSGLGTSAFPAQVDKQILFRTKVVTVPFWAAFKDLKDPDEIKSMTVNTRHPKTLRACIPLPHFLVTIIMDMSESSILDIILAVMAAIRAFDTAHDGDTSYSKAYTACQSGVHWLSTIDRSP